MELERERPRFGYQRLPVLLRPRGEQLSHKRTASDLPRGRTDDSAEEADTLRTVTQPDGQGLASPASSQPSSAARPFFLTDYVSLPHATCIGTFSATGPLLFVKICVGCVKFCNFCQL